jgi:serine/threonine-protein kinase
VAIKYLSEQLRLDLAFVAAFRHEARLLQILRTPHAAAFYEYVESPDGAAIIMELVDGVSLRRLLHSEGPTGPEAALAILKGSRPGLAAAHGAGIVHRDYKPENVIVEADGNSKLVDFGIAARSGDPGDGSGTPSYMAPEQWSGGQATAATDVYAATAVFFECLTGMRPFRADNVAALARQHQTAEPPVDDVPEPLRDLVRRGLAKHPLDRPESADAFLAELEEIAEGAYGRDWEDRGKRRLSSLAALLVLLFPLHEPGEAVPESGTALAHTELGGGAPKVGRLGLKIVVGLGALAAVVGAGAVVVNTMNGTELQAQSTAGSPSPTLTSSAIAAPTEEPVAEPETTPPDTPKPTPTKASAEPEPTSAPVVPTYRPPVVPPKPKPTHTRKPTHKPTHKATHKPTAAPTATRSTPPATEEPQPTFSGGVKPPSRTKTSAPSPTRTIPTSRPTRTVAPPPETAPPDDGGEGDGDGGDDGGTREDPPTGAFVLGFGTAGLLPAALTLRIRRSRRRRRR